MPSGAEWGILWGPRGQEAGALWVPDCGVWPQPAGAPGVGLRQQGPCLGTIRYMSCTAQGGCGNRSSRLRRTAFCSQRSAGAHEPRGRSDFLQRSGFLLARLSCEVFVVNWGEESSEAWKVLGVAITDAAEWAIHGEAAVPGQAGQCEACAPGMGRAAWGAEARCDGLCPVVHPSVRSPPDRLPAPQCPAARPWHRTPLAPTHP